MTNHSEGAGRRRSTDPQAEQRPQPVHQDDWVERDRPEAGRNESERLLWATFDRAVIGIAHTSPDGRWLRCNQRLCDLLGYSRDELPYSRHPWESASRLVLYGHKPARPALLQRRQKPHVAASRDVQGLPGGY